MTPDFEQFKVLAKTHDLIPIHESLPADLDTPISVFGKIQTGKYDFLYESVVGGKKWARYSFLGTSPKKIYQLVNGDFFCVNDQGRKEKMVFQKSPLEIFRKEFASLKVYQDPALPRFFGGVVGYIGYDTVKYFENLSLKNNKKSDLSELCMMLTDSVIIFDNVGQVMKVVNSVMLSDEVKKDPKKLREVYDEAAGKIESLKKKLQQPISALSENFSMSSQRKLGSSLRSDNWIPAFAGMTQELTEKEYCAKVLKAKKYIEAGDIFQVVPSLRFEMPAAGVDSFAVYRSLRRINPSPYMYYLVLGDIHIAGASPEVLVRLEGNLVEVRPIAGTRKRGDTEKRDKELEHELRTDPKERAEHVMLVDLGRNDVGKVAKTGSVKVEENELIERYSHVMHLVSHVKGEMAPGKDVFDVIEATFPAGTLTGAPKIRAMQIIDELEDTARGIYGGGIGYISFSGNTDLAIAIRTAVFHNGKIRVQAGGGVVYNSVPELEYKECLNKARAMITAIKDSQK